ncbi:MAG TPA: hypothetical protein VFK86_10395, partial [Bauldia sp.]|nr:hypothetical protein [Bauldia sp.]
MRIRCWLAVAAFLPLAPQTSFAEEAVEAAIRDWISAIDALPDWSATYGGLIYDPTSDTALLTDLAVRAEPNAPAAGMVVTLATLSVAGYVEGPDGFKVRSVTADGGLLDAGLLKLRLSDVALSDLSLPATIGFTYDDQKPFTSIMLAYREALKIGLRQGHIGSLELDQTHEGVNSTVVYENFRVDDFANGKVAGFFAGPIRMESPTPDGLIKMTIASVESRDTDLGAFVHVYDPGSYVNGVGDMVWRDGLAYAAYNDIVMDVPGAKLGIGSVILEDFKLRQPPESFTGFFDDMIMHPDMPDALAQRLAMRAVPAILSAFSVGRFAVLNTTVQALGIDHLAIGDFHLNGFSVDGLNEFGLEGVEAVVQGQGAVELDRFAFGGITFGGYDALSKIVAAGSASPPGDVTELLPRLGFVELLGLDLQTPDIPRLTLERMRADMSDYVGILPTRAALDIAGISIPVSAITEPEARDIFRRLGYDRIVTAMGFSINYDEVAERMTLEDLHYSIAEMGSFVVSGTLAGLPLSAFQDEHIFESVAPQLRLEKARFTFKDDS